MSRRMYTKAVLVTIWSLCATVGLLNAQDTQAAAQLEQAVDQSPTLPMSQSDLTTLTGNIQRPNGLVWNEDQLYASCSGDWTLYQIDPIEGTTSQYIYGVKNAHTLFAEGAGADVSLWIPDFQSNSLINVSQGGIRNIVSNLGGPWGIAALNDATFAVTSLKGNSLLLIPREGGNVSEAISNLRSPAGITVKGDHIFIANSGSARRAIEYYQVDTIVESSTPLDSGLTISNASLVTGVQNVTGLALGNEGYLYFSYSLGTRGVVGRISPDVCIEKGGCEAIDVEVVLYTELAAPLAGLTITPDNVLYIHTIYSPDIFFGQIPQVGSS